MNLTLKKGKEIYVFRIAKQMAKERQDFLKDASSEVVADGE